MMGESGLPMGVEHAAEAFAKACGREGLDGYVDLHVVNGTIHYLYTEGKYHALIEGNWRVDEEVL